ncbi:MAG: hypothetical protein AAF611_14455 [Bacteroidota bacterium]
MQKGEVAPHKKSYLQQIGQLIREIIPVMIGILVALVINNWNEDRKSKKYLNQIFISIEKELNETSIDIEKSLSKQKVLVDTLQKYMTDETIPMVDIIKKAKGLYGPTIKNYSWKAIAATNIELIEFEKISALSEIDQSKKSIELKLEKKLDFLYEHIKSTDPEKKEVFMLLVLELMSTERFLLLEIKEFLKNLKPETQESTSSK